jgi:hypothetical protein
LYSGGLNSGRSLQAPAVQTRLHPSGVGETARRMCWLPRSSVLRNLHCWDWCAENCPCGVPIGSCRVHPRARPAQRLPAGNWRTWLAPAGRGWGKTRCGGEWIRQLVETAQARRLASVAPTAADVRDVMVEGDERIFGSRVLGRWPFRPVVDGLDQVEILLDSGGAPDEPPAVFLPGAPSPKAPHVFTHGWTPIAARYSLNPKRTRLPPLAASTRGDGHRFA